MMEDLNDLCHIFSTQVSAKAINWSSGIKRLYENKVDVDIDSLKIKDDFAFLDFFQLTIHGLEFVSLRSNKANTGLFD